MKLALALALVATPAFASSVCLFRIPDEMGVKTTLTCDGKKSNLFEVSDGWEAKQTTTLNGLIEKGYKIASEVKDSGADQYTLVKE